MAPGPGQHGGVDVERERGREVGREGWRGGKREAEGRREGEREAGCGGMHCVQLKLGKRDDLKL